MERGKAVPGALQRGDAAALSAPSAGASSGAAQRAPVLASGGGAPEGGPAAASDASAGAADPPWALDDIVWCPHAMVRPCPSRTAALQGVIIKGLTRVPRCAAGAGCRRVAGGAAAAGVGAAGEAERLERPRLRVSCAAGAWRTASSLTRNRRSHVPRHRLRRPQLPVRGAEATRAAMRGPARRAAASHPAVCRTPRFYQRLKICALHLRCDSVLVADVPMRFCQARAVARAVSPPALTASAPACALGRSATAWSLFRRSKAPSAPACARWRCTTSGGGSSGSAWARQEGPQPQSSLLLRHRRPARHRRTRRGCLTREMTATTS